LLAAGAAAVTLAYYLICLGHRPDWYGYAETALGVSGGVTALAIKPWGPVAVLLLVFWVIATTAVRTTAIMRSPADSVPVWASLALVWAVGSYFVGRSHAITVTNLLPTLVLASAIALREPTMETAARTACAVLFAAVLLFAVHDPSAWSARGPVARRWALHIAPLRITLNESQLALMEHAGISPGSAIAYVDPNVFPAWPADTNARVADGIWLPTLPLGLVDQIRAERRSLYVERFVQRARRGGWLVERMSGLPDLRWLTDPLARTHRAARTVTTGDWRATYYEFAPQ
jgi:hypothetical protein